MTRFPLFKIIGLILFLGGTGLSPTKALAAPLNTASVAAMSTEHLALSPLMGFACNFSTQYIVYIDGWSKERVLAMPKGERPMPAVYLKPWYMAVELMRFKDGGSWLVTADILEQFGRELIGRADGQFIMPRSEMDEVLKLANGDIAIVEEELGIPNGLWTNKKIIRIDVPFPQNQNIRIPSGNEVGANTDWLPGGQLPKGYYEAIIDRIPKGCYLETPLDFRSQQKP